VRPLCFFGGENRFTKEDTKAHEGRRVLRLYTFVALGRESDFGGEWILAVCPIPTLGILIPSLVILTTAIVILTPTLVIPIPTFVILSREATKNLLSAGSAQQQVPPTR
jgi:hypothetical protein